MLRPFLSKVGYKLDQYRLLSYRDRSSFVHEKLGTRYGGWHVPVMLLDVASICYCVGAGEDISFDIELINRYGCEVYTFDPTPRASQHIERLKRNTSIGENTLVDGDSTQYDANAKVLSHLHFYPYGLWDERKTMRFYAPKNRDHVSHSLVNLQKTHEFFEAECRTVKQVMVELSHPAISLLKLDIEGAEYKVLDSLLTDRIFPRIICVEFDEGHTHQDQKYFERIIQAILKLKKVGYLATHFDQWNVTFVREVESQTSSVAISAV
ncbi:MAG: hypothetical protein OJF51_005128 [Nitrospira sp.]|nr:MAG: hypothetical protein OJF51_005128 [Nitrospira sp.]